ncbi:MAG: peptidylprolyl isomerase, partial [Clostridiales bacterium]
MKKLLVVFMIGLMLISGGCAANGGDSVFATINDSPVYQSEMDYYFSSNFLDYYSNYYDYFLTYMGVDLMDEESAKTTLSDMEKYCWDVVNKGEIIRQVATEDYAITWEDNYLKDVLPNGAYRSLMINDMYKDLFYAVQDEMLAAIDVSEDDAKAAYDADPTKWDSRRSSHILIKADPADEAAMSAAYDKAVGLIDQLNDGADFAELAKANSDDGSAKDGGALPNYINVSGVDVESGTSLYEEYTAAVFAFEKVGDYSLVPVKTQAGYHIIKLDDIRSGYDASVDAVKASLKSVSNEDVSARLDELLTAKKDSATIVMKGAFHYYDPNAVVDDGTTDTGATDEGATDTGATDEGATDTGATDEGA